MLRKNVEWPLFSEIISLRRGALCCLHITFERCCVCKKCREKLFHFSSCIAFWWNYSCNSGCRRILCGMRIEVHSRHSCFYLFRNYFYVVSSWMPFLLLLFFVLSFPFFLVDCRIFRERARFTIIPDTRIHRRCCCCLADFCYFFCYCFDLSPNTV